MGFADLARLIFENLPVFIVFVSLGIALGLTIQARTPRAYEARAKFVIDKLPYTGGKETVDSETERQLIQTIILSIPSRDMANSVEQRLDLGTDSRRVVFQELDPPLKLTGSVPEANVRVEAIRDSRLGEIAAVSQNPDFAAQVANAVLDEIQLYNIIGGQLNTLRQSMTIARSLSDNLLNEFSQVSAQRIKLERENAELDKHLEQGLPIESFPSFANDPTLNNLKTQLILVQSEYESIAATASRGARLSGKRSEVEGLVAQLKAHVQQLVVALRSELEIARTQEEDLRKNLREESARIDRMGEQVAALTQSYADPAKMKELAQSNTIESTGPASIIVTIDRATPQMKPVRPKLWLNLLLGTMFGLALSGAVIGGRLFFDTRIKSAAQLESRTHVPVLTLLPRHTPLFKGIRNRSIFDHPGYPIGLGFLRSELLRSGARNPKNRVVGFTSVQQHGNYQSDLIANLAILLAQAEKRTLVIDLHLNAPRQAEKLGIHPKIGLTEWLASDDESPDAYISYSAIRELAVLSPVVKHRDIDDLLSRKPLLGAMPALLEKWDFILVDSPPILADWSMLLTLPQGSPVILTARHRRATIEEFLACSDRVVNEGWRVKGAVLQGCPRAICPRAAGRS